MLPTLGIDISKDSFHVELSRHEKLRHRRFANRQQGFDELRSWLTKHEVMQVHACLEAIGPYSEELTLYLHRQGHTVSVVNPAQIKAFGQSELLRNKDDRHGKIVYDQPVVPALTETPVQFSSKAVTS